MFKMPKSFSEYIKMVFSFLTSKVIEVFLVTKLRSKCLILLTMSTAVSSPKYAVLELMENGF